MRPLMKCGHSGNARLSDGRWICAICIGINRGATEYESALPNLDGRIARCSTCGRETASDLELPFFEYQPECEYDTYYCGCWGWE